MRFGRAPHARAQATRREPQTHLHTCAGHSCRNRKGPASLRSNRAVGCRWVARFYKSTFFASMVKLAELIESHWQEYWKRFHGRLNSVFSATKHKARVTINSSACVRKGFLFG